MIMIIELLFFGTPYKPYDIKICFPMIITRPDIGHGPGVMSPWIIRFN